MSTWAFDRALACNGHLVPRAKLTAHVIDPHSLGGVDLEGEATLNAVDLSANANTTWLVGPRAPIQKKPFWWKANAGRIQTLNEIKANIKAGKPSARMPKERKSFVFVQVRGKTILVLNDPRRVLLALTCSPGAGAASWEGEEGILQWLTAELQEDIKTLTVPEEAKAPRAAKAGRGAVDPVMQEGLESLNAVEAVRTALWLPSRSTIKVTLNDNNAKEFRVLSSKKRKTTAMFVDGAQAIKNAVAEALGWARCEGVIVCRT